VENTSTDIYAKTVPSPCGLHYSLLKPLGILFHYFLTRPFQEISREVGEKANNKLKVQLRLVKIIYTSGATNIIYLNLLYNTHS
jgi:hypothetical protein